MNDTDNITLNALGLQGLMSTSGSVYTDTTAQDLTNPYHYGGPSYRDAAMPNIPVPENLTTFLEMYSIFSDKLVLTDEEMKTFGFENPITMLKAHAKLEKLKALIVENVVNTENVSSSEIMGLDKFNHFAEDTYIINRILNKFLGNTTVPSHFYHRSEVRADIMFKLNGYLQAFDYIGEGGTNTVMGITLLAEMDE